MSNAALYNEMYQAGYEIACKNRNSEMADDMLSMCKISNLMRYEIACKHDFKEEIIKSRKGLDKDDMFRISCEVGNINEAFDIYEQNIDYIDFGNISFALHNAYNNEQYALVLKFVKIYELSDLLILDLLRSAIKTSLNSDKRSIKKEHEYIDALCSHLQPNDIFKLACSCHDKRLVDSLLNNDSLNKQECFISACLSGNNYVVSQLRDQCRWHYNSSLELVCRHTKNLSTVKLLVDYGADNISECKELAKSSGFNEAVNFFSEIGF